MNVEELDLAIVHEWPEDADSGFQDIIDAMLDVDVAAELDADGKTHAVDAGVKAPGLDVDVDVKAPGLDVDVDVNAAALDVDVDVVVDAPALDQSVESPVRKVNLSDLDMSVLKGSWEVKAPSVKCDMKAPSVKCDVKTGDVDMAEDDSSSVPRAQARPRSSTLLPRQVPEPTETRPRSCSLTAGPQPRLDLSARIGRARQRVANVKSQKHSESVPSECALHDAVRTGNRRLVTRLIGGKTEFEGTDKKDKGGWSCLMLAATRGDLGIVALLIAAGADVTVVNIPSVHALIHNALRNLC